MRKTALLFLLPIFTIIFLFFPGKNLSFAQSKPNFCSPNLPPNSVGVDSNLDAIVKIYIPNPENLKFWIWAGDTRADGTISEKKYAVFNLGKLPPGGYKFDLFINGSSMGCSSSINIPDNGQEGVTSSNNLSFSPERPTGDTTLAITATSLKEDGKYTLVLFKGGPYTSAFTSRRQCTDSIDKQVSFLVEPLGEGAWGVDVYKTDLTRADECGSIGGKIASGQITISAGDPTPTPKTPSFCAKDAFKDGKCLAVETAIGKISTDPVAFVRSIFTLVLGISGGVALILIIISGYKFLVSAGNPETIKEATGQLTSAIIGLLFIIFSFVILQVIGVEILKIPGFRE